MTPFDAMASLYTEISEWPLPMPRFQTMTAFDTDSDYDRFRCRYLKLWPVSRWRSQIMIISRDCFNCHQYTVRHYWWSSLRTAALLKIISTQCDCFDTHRYTPRLFLTLSSIHLSFSIIPQETIDFIPNDWAKLMCPGRGGVYFSDSFLISSRAIVLCTL